ncbi:cell surface protein [Methanosarcinales archaeon]|nr:MAG: cell surface protein [Methanosarcinales archaeon]
MTRIRKGPVLLLSIFIIVVISQAAMAGEWRGSGTPLYTIASGSMHGGVHVDGGHGLTYADPYTEYFDLPDNIIYARLYVPMWNYNKGDTLTVSINDNELKTREEPDYIAAWGVCCYAYDVTEVPFKEGLNVISATYENNNGAPYGIFLVTVYENESMPYTQFWIDEGNYALSKAVADGGAKEQGEALFPGDVKTETVEKADLWTVMIAGTGGEIDELWFNSKLLGKDVGRAKTGSYLDFDHFNVTDDLVGNNNTALFKRGGEQYLHPFNAVLVIEHKSGVEGDKELTVYEAQSSLMSVIPIPVVAVLAIAIIGFFLIYLKKKQERG